MIRFFDHEDIIIYKVITSVKGFTEYLKKN